jgi:chromosome segregation ATPase
MCDKCAVLTARIKELESRPQFGNDEVGRIKDKYGQRIKELESILNLVGEDPVWVSLHVEQRYEICRLEKRIKELEEELNCLKEDFKIAVQTRNELWDRVKELEEDNKKLTEAMEKIVNLPNNDYWDDEEIHSAIDIAKAALGGKI